MTRWKYTLLACLAHIAFSAVFGFFWYRAHSLQYRYLPTYIWSSVQGEYIRPSPTKNALDQRLTAIKDRFFGMGSNADGTVTYKLWRTYRHGRWTLAQQSDMANPYTEQHSVQLLPAGCHSLLNRYIYRDSMEDVVAWPLAIWLVTVFTFLLVGIIADIRWRARLSSEDGVQLSGRKFLPLSKFNGRARRDDFVIKTEQPIGE